jgi:hypothetical protein
MALLNKPAAFFALFLSLGAVFGVAPLWAASSASSAASDSVTQILGSFSNSLGKSSDSSKGGEKAAAGDYKIIEVAEVFEAPRTAQSESGATPSESAGDRLRLKLQAVADASPAGELFLFLPRAAVAQGRLETGDVVTAKTRPYGLEFSVATTQQPFFLVLHDDWFRELQTRPISL